MDGKDLRGASKQTEDGRRMMVAAVEHDTGVVLGQVEVDRKSNEIPAVRELSSGLDLTGRIVTMDAMHAQHETARCLLGRRADYVMSAVKDNQEMIFEDLKAIDFSDALWHETVDKGHGRIERRRCAVVDLSAAEWDGYANLHGRRQAMRIEREREILKTGKRRHRGDLEPHLARRRARRTRGVARTGAQPLAYREPPALRARLHLRRRPMPGLRASPAQKSRLLDQRGHRHRALATDASVICPRPTGTMPPGRRRPSTRS